MDYSGCLLMNSKKLSVPFQLQCFPEMLNLGKFQELNNKNKITFLWESTIAIYAAMQPANSGAQVSGSNLEFNPSKVPIISC